LPRTPEPGHKPEVRDPRSAIGIPQSLKVAISGKGGVGKSTLAAALAILSVKQGARVLAVDADPDGSLASSLGIDPATQRERIVPIAARRALIEERTGARVRQYGQMFTLNPRVSDIADSYAYVHDGVAVLALGAGEKGGGGCACPENALLRALVSDLVLQRNETVILDMEAGIEHLGRATASGVDTMLIVVEPGQRAVDSARRVLARAADIGLHDVRIVVNKSGGPGDEQFVRAAFPGVPVCGVIPYVDAIRANERNGRAVLAGLAPALVSPFERVLEALAGRAQTAGVGA
jgi:CO dehydrogenase maturation factor